MNALICVVNCSYSAIRSTCAAAVCNAIFVYQRQWCNKVLEKKPPIFLKVSSKVSKEQSCSNTKNHVRGCPMCEISRKHASPIFIYDHKLDCTSICERVCLVY